LCHITSPASASPEMMTATTVSTAPTTCSIDFPLYWFIALWIGCALIALEIFHWAFQPLLRWIVRRFA
jgi:hypothetical protein